MPSSAHFTGSQGIKINIDVLEGRRLVAKDSSGVLRNKSSDPYVLGIYNGESIFHTRTIEKSLSPVWNESFALNLGLKEIKKVMEETGTHGEIHFVIFDKDKMSEDDPLGTVYVPIIVDESQQDLSPKWYKVGRGEDKYYCKKASGELRLKISVSVKQMTTLVSGTHQFIQPKTILHVGVGWDQEGGSVVELDTSCVAIDYRGNILIHETVYYGIRSNSNSSIVHSGGVDEGNEDFNASLDDEVITCDLDGIPQHVCALYFILTVATPGMTLDSIGSVSVRIINKHTGMVICQILPADAGQNTALFLLRAARDTNKVGSWIISVVEGTHPEARDFGALIPEIKGYTSDIIPNIVIDPYERIAILPKKV